MDGFFKKLSLPLKLFLLVLLPLGLIVFLTIRVNREKNENVSLIENYVKSINESVDISNLLNQLQLERRHSYVFAVKHDSASITAARDQWIATDTALLKLDQYNDDLNLKEFRTYTFLDKLDSIRKSVSAGTSADAVMHYYTTTIFRLKTLSHPESNNRLLKPVNSRIVVANILNEISTYLGIIRANFYNALYQKQNNVPMLNGLLGPYQVMKSYEKELVVKAEPDVLREYQKIVSLPELRETNAYIDTIFRRFTFDTLYNSEDWWTVSGIATDQVKAFQERIMKDVKGKVETQYHKESSSRNWNLVFLLLAILLVIAIMAVTTREIKELDRRKNDFITMASHELKTPITSIKGYVQLLLAMFKEFERTRQLPQESSVRSSLHTLDKQVNKLTRLLSELLDLSRLESGIMELQKKQFNLNELVTETIEEVQYTAPNHSIHFDADNSHFILADQERIGQVILNLLTNAVKYSPGGEPVSVKLFGVNGTVTLCVVDSGIGIDKKEQGKIFERFYRVEGKSEQTYPGFGIGLYIASEIIQRHGGSLMVESESGRGSVFSFTIPVISREHL